MIPRELRSLDVYARAEAPLLHHEIRLAKAIGPAFDMQQYADSVVTRLESPVAVRFEFRRRTELIFRALRDSLPAKTRVRRIEELEAGCPVRSNWDRINRVVREALEGLSIAEMARPLLSVKARVGTGAWIQ